MTIDEALKHVGSAYNSEYVKRRALEAIPHYIWTQGNAKNRSGYCTACGQWIEKIEELPEWVVQDPYAEDYASEFEGPYNLFQTMDTAEYNEKVTGKSKHLDYGWCPLCGARVQFRSLNMGRKHLNNRIFLIVYSKSEIDGDAITCVGYSADVYWNEMNAPENMAPPIKIDPFEVCVFRDKKGGQRFLKENDYFSGKENEWHYKWIRKRECKSGYMKGDGFFGYGVESNRKFLLDITAFEETVEGTRIGKLLPALKECEGNAWFDKIGMIDRMMRYPCIEYIIRLGFLRLAVNTIDQKCGNILNYRGKTAKAVLRLTDEQWGEVKGKRLDISIDTLKMKDYFAKYGIRTNMELCVWVEGFDKFYVDDVIARAREIGTEPIKVLNYCKRKDVQLHDYMDYIRQLDELRMPKDKKYLFPKNFETMHNRMTNRIGYKKNRKYDTAISKRLEGLGEYCFSSCGLVIRPMASSAEIVNEGTALCHCVGGYVAGYANGNSILCALRYEEAPDIPLYTVEFSKTGELVQCRGRHNRIDPKDEERLALFWKLFEETRPDRKKQINLKKIAQKKERKIA